MRVYLPTNAHSSVTSKLSLPGSVVSSGSNDSPYLRIFERLAISYRRSILWFCVKYESSSSIDVFFLSINCYLLREVNSDLYKGTMSIAK